MTDIKDNRQFFAWVFVPFGNAAPLCRLEGIESWRFLEHEPLTAVYPNDVRLHMHPDHPKDVQLIDAHTDGVLTIISQRIKNLLGERPGIEYLPVSIIDHKGRLASSDYFILHASAGVDCLDLVRSKPQYNFIDKDCIDRVKHTVIDPTRVPSNVQLFGIHKFTAYLIVEASVKQELEAAKIQGVKFIPAQDYPKRQPAPPPP